jgi:Protein of unknown function (DUF3800)
LNPDSEAILALISGYSHYERMRRLLVILQPAIDDSGKGERPVFVLAGFVMSAYMWIVFADQWRPLLDAFPKINYFKMKEAEHLSGQFEGFSVSQRDDKVRALTSLIMDHKPLAVSHVVPHEAYERCFKRKFAKKADYPYFISYYGIIGTLLRYQVSNEWHLKDRSDFIFDEQGKESDYVQSGWSAAVDFLPEEWKPLIGARPDHRDDKLFLPLQAADLFAWHIRRSYWEKDHGSNFDDLNWKRLNSLKCAKEEWDEERLAGFTERLRASGLVFEYDLKTKKERKRYKKILREKLETR